MALDHDMPSAQYTREGMALWDIVFDPDCWAWFITLDEGLQNLIFAAITRLEEDGPQVGRPLVDTLKGSKLKNLKEIRLRYRGCPWRILFVFAPDRRGVLLVGGNKAGDKRWYREAIATAEERYQRWSEA